MEQPDFQNSPLETMVAVGNLDGHSCRIWVRSDQAGRCRLEYWRENSPDSLESMQFEISEENSSDNAVALQLPSGGKPPLEPLTRYAFRVGYESDGQLIREGSFETFPARPEDTPDRFSIALVSCNQPFQNDGSLHPDSLSMLRAAKEAMSLHDCKFLLEMGDQMYSDCPRPLSLFDDDYFRRFAPAGRSRLLECSPEEVRRLYQRRYRHFFGLDEWQQIHARFPCFPILDDHDIVDNWGSVAEHQNPQWQSVWQGARLAYCDYQASRILPAAETRGHFGYPIVYGNVATYVMDLRSHRHADGGGLFCEEQLADVARFLNDQTDKQALLLVLSVPPVHLPRWASRLASKMVHTVEDFSDRWSAPGHLADRDRLLKMVHRHQQKNPRQPVILLSGDIHIGCAHQIQWRDGTPPLYQFISSAISHCRDRMESLAAKYSIRANRGIKIDDKGLRASVRRVPAAERSMHNPYADLNLGIVEFTRRGDGGEIRFLLYGQNAGHPVCVYRSKPITLQGGG